MSSGATCTPRPCSPARWLRAASPRHRHDPLRRREQVSERTFLGPGMIRIESEPWDAMVAHAEAKFPNECCGAMIGATDGDTKHVIASPSRSKTPTTARKAARYELRPEDLLAADKAARAARPGSDRHLPLAPRLRRVFLEDRSRELLPVVFVRRTLDSRTASSTTPTASCPTPTKPPPRKKRY